MKRYKWKSQKNEWLKIERKICFEDIVFNIEKGNLLDIIENPNQEKYKNQKVYIVKANQYVYMVPFFESEDGNFLITIIPNRKMTKLYLEDKNE